MKITGKTELKFEPAEKHVDEDTGEAIALYDIQINGKDTGVSEVVHSKGREVNRTYKAMASPDDKAPTIHEDVLDAFRAAGHEVQL